MVRSVIVGAYGVTVIHANVALGVLVTHVDANLGAVPCVSRIRVSVLLHDVQYVKALIVMVIAKPEAAAEVVIR